ncbi:MAG: AAA family ATPase, partial [Desulfofustis sp.]|nr:AAA family ATPase [Desulfofustis sp.]
MQTNRQPFHDTIDTAIFYGGGSRREIVDDIKAAFADEAELLTLAGTDGSGKTMICRMVELELQGSAEILFFEQGAESFDEVVNRIAAHVELEESDQISDRNDRLEKSVEILHQQDRRLILILDGAEKIFLATLERIRRMLDQVNGSRVSIQLLISGRPLFSLNYKQLAIINFKVVKEQHFSLDPLDGKATHLYLNHCLDQSDTEEQKRFSLSQA